MLKLELFALLSSVKIFALVASAIGAIVSVVFSAVTKKGFFGKSQEEKRDKSDSDAGQLSRLVESERDILAKSDLKKTDIEQLRQLADQKTKLLKDFKSSS